MSALGFVLGGGALAAYLLSRERKLEIAPSVADKLETPRPRTTWVWPVAAWNGRSPVVSDGFGSPRGAGRHLGVDIMFKRLPADPFRVGSPNGSRLFVMPDDVPALAVSDGVVWSAMWSPRGYAVVIDHSPLPFLTFYTHLERLLVPLTAPRSKTRTKVRTGQPIGIIGYSPQDKAKLKHLHFELWLEKAANAIDPAMVLKGWPIVGAERDLKGESGVYVIRQRDSREVVYVGSSVGRLYDTLTRHFQTWRRFKGFWKGQYAEGHDPGLTYDRDSVEVAVRTTRASDALDEESRLIQRLRPRDNLIGQPVDDVPF